MDPVRNPFQPGAGTRPPEFVGREAILNTASVGVQRAMRGRLGRSLMLLGLRGTGKTVLLNRLRTDAEAHRAITLSLEATEAGEFARRLYPELRTCLRQLSMSETAKDKAHKAMRALRSFAGGWTALRPKSGTTSSPWPNFPETGPTGRAMWRPNWENRRNGSARGGSPS